MILPAITRTTCRRHVANRSCSRRLFQQHQHSMTQQSIMMDLIQPPMMQFSTKPKTFPAPRLFDYATVTANLTVSDAIESVEQAFAELSKGKVDVPVR